jgi:hypothetical protein
MSKYFCFSQGVDHEAEVVEEEVVSKIEFLWRFTYIFDPPSNVRTASERAPCPDPSYCPAAQVRGCSTFS